MSSIVSNIEIKCLTSSPEYLPKRAHKTDAGADLTSAESLTLYPGELKMVDTGVAVKVPFSCVGLVFNRSSQGKRNIIVTNGVGVIDSDYRGHIKVLLRNDGDGPYEIIAGKTRIAQLVIVPIYLANFVDVWNDTERGSDGFGSTG